VDVVTIAATKTIKIGRQTDIFESHSTSVTSYIMDCIWNYQFALGYRNKSTGVHFLLWSQLI